VWQLGAMFVLAAGGFAAVLATRSPPDRSQLWSEVGKGLVALVFAGILGTALKLLADDYQERRQIEERRAEFRQDKYRRVVLATSALRKAAALLAANRSVKTWTEQTIALIDAANELRLIKHEIDLSTQALRDDPPFGESDDIIWLLRRMYAYLESLTVDFAEKKAELGELQRRAAEEKASAAERAKLLEAIWSELNGLKSVQRLLAEFDPELVPKEIPKTEALARQHSTQEIAIRLEEEPGRARVLYEAAEAVVLRQIAAGALGTRRRHEWLRLPP
jgi:hypothetical protein